MKSSITLILALAAFSPIAYTCSCGNFLLDLPIKEMGWTDNESDGISSFSDLIFTGTLIDYYPVTEQQLRYLYNESTTHKVEMIFTLIKSYKGEKRDTIRIRTNAGSDACGFYAPKGTDCIVFAMRSGNDYFYTYRSDCCKSISKAADEKRYSKYVRFLESIQNMTDGKYNFKQTKSYWYGAWIDQADTLDLISYAIKDGKFHGRWTITDRKGRILEIGAYQDGQKVGVWKIFTYSAVDYGVYTQKIEQLQYKNGKPVKSLVTITDMKRNFEDGSEKAVRTQKIIKTYKYN